MIQLYYRWCRWFDMRLLWPEIRRQARDLNHARLAFMMHAKFDPAWRSLGSDEDVVDMILELTAE